MCGCCVLAGPAGFLGERKCEKGRSLLGSWLHGDAGSAGGAVGGAAAAGGAGAAAAVQHGEWTLRSSPTLPPPRALREVLTAALWAAVAVLVLDQGAQGGVARARQPPDFRSLGSRLPNASSHAFQAKGYYNYCNLCGDHTMCRFYVGACAVAAHFP